MELNITEFFKKADPCLYSGSIATRGDNVANETYGAALQDSSTWNILATPEQLEAAKAYFKTFGAWDGDEIATWSDFELNALMIQFISAEMNEHGMDGMDFDWDAHENSDDAGRIFMGDDGEIYYYIGS